MVGRLSTNVERDGPLSQPRQYGSPRPPSSSITTPPGHSVVEPTSRVAGSTTPGNHTNNVSRFSGKNCLPSWQLPSPGVTAGPASAFNSFVTTKPWSPHGSTNQLGTPPCSRCYTTSSCMLHVTITPLHFNTYRAFPTA